MNFSPILLILSFWTSLLDAQIYPFVKQYYECKNLKMIKYNDSYGFKYFIPDPSIANNTLEDSFYVGIGFDTMSFDDAMSLFKSIYDETPGDCETELCECVRLRRFTTTVEKYSIFFESDETLKGLKSVIQSLDETLAESRVSFEDFSVSNFYVDPVNYPTLTKFSYNNEFTYFRTIEYKNYDNCIMNSNLEKLDLQNLRSCYWLSTIDFERRESIKIPTVEQIEYKIVCSLLARRECPSEQRRFEVISSLEQLTDDDLIGYIDSLITRADSYEPEIIFESSGVLMSQTSLTVISYRNNFEMLPFKPEYTTAYLEALDSNSSVIILKFDTREDTNEVFLSKGIITTTSYEFDVAQLDLDESKVEEYINKNDTIIVSESGVRMFEILKLQYGGENQRLRIIDFNTRSIIEYQRNGIFYDAPRLLFELDSKGLLVDGIDDIFFL